MYVLVNNVQPVFAQGSITEQPNRTHPKKEEHFYTIWFSLIHPDFDLLLCINVREQHIVSQLYAEQSDIWSLHYYVINFIKLKFQCESSGSWSGPVPRCRGNFPIACC